MRASRSSTPNWQQLGEARRRGQRPLGWVYLSDHERQRYNFLAAGAYMLDLPEPEQVIYLAGLMVHMIATRNERSQQMAMLIAGAYPEMFSIHWRGEGVEHVLL